MEAALILTESPRGAAALLRLAIQKLCEALGEKGSVDDMIGSLVKKGLLLQVQQSLDIVRVTGNNAVHPGQMDVKDVEVAASIFPLVNIIVEQMIAGPKKIGALYGTLPQRARDAIARRDAPKS